MSKVIVIGGGPAGMFAAYFAAKKGHKVTLLEQNEKLGKKLYITGKGRCNITNASDMEELFKNVCSNPKFLYSAFYSYTNDQVVEFFESFGLQTKVERGNRVFPMSDHSSDVIATLNKALKSVGVEVRLYTKVKEIITNTSANAENEAGVENYEPQVAGVLLTDGTKIEADAVILATGGVSYVSTGATGDGYRFAEKLNHRIVEPTPSLVPFETKESWVPELQGLALKNVSIKIVNGKKTLYEDFGEMLFTHFGVSGPMILSASAAIKPEYIKEQPMCYIDLKPALDEETLDKRVLREFDDAKNKQYKNSIQKLLPGKMVPVIIELSGIDPDKKVNEISKEERKCLVNLLKALPITITGTRGWNEAIITRGGISVKDVNPSTMESKKVKKLYICGEVLDLDAMTGGFNLQIAWSTGYLAGNSIE
ncbi:MAG: NAD(P)/FAD-dependent oxidoreductase [Lachnospiraceae bacterium]|nr:NAD(P)/FAD-dependent oxidoreductase [Lachnospiraceae bacterium]